LAGVLAAAEFVSRAGCFRAGFFLAAATSKPEKHDGPPAAERRRAAFCATSRATQDRRYV
jgi:hypothetical protein